MAAAATTKCLRFKEPEVDDYVVYKYTESESTEDALTAIGTETSELKDGNDEEETKLNKNLISDTTIKSSIELLSSEHNNKNNNEIKENEEKNKKSNIEDNNSNKNSSNNNININNDEDNKSNKSSRSNKSNSENNINRVVNNVNNTQNSLYESMESFVIYKDGDSAIIEGVPQIEIKLNISRDNLLANKILNNINNSIDKNLNSNSMENKLEKSNSKLSINSSGSRNNRNNKANSRTGSKNSLLGSSKINSRASSKNSLSGSFNKINKNENIKKSNSGLLRKSNNSIASSRQSSRSSLYAPRPEGNTRNLKSIEDRSLERTQQAQKKMMERKLMREKLRSEMNEKRNKKLANEVSINITNLENNEKEKNDKNMKVKLVSREKPINNKLAAINSYKTSGAIKNLNSFSQRNKDNYTEIIPKKNEDVNEILKEVGETYFLVDDSDITLDYVLKIIGQTEINTIDNTIGSECLETATHMKNYEHGAIFKLPSEDNCIMKVIPFDPERNDLDIDRSCEDNQVSLKTVFQEVIASTVLAYLHTSGEVTASTDDLNQVTLEIEDEELRTEKKILAFSRPEGTWICKGSINQAFNYEFQNYQLSGFSQDQYFLVIVYSNKGEIINSSNNTNRSLDQIKSVLWQICYSLALAEDSLGFEHRELYPECILVEEVPREKLKYKMRDGVIMKDNFGVKATILDYSRSRLEYGGRVYYSDLTNVVYDDPSKKKGLEDLKTVLDSTWYQSSSIVNRSSFADLIQSLAWIVQCDKAMTNWLYNNMLEFAVRVEYNIHSMNEALNDPFWNITKKDWETYEIQKLNEDNDINADGDCIIL